MVVVCTSSHALICRKLAVATGTFHQNGSISQWKVFGIIHSRWQIMGCLYGFSKKPLGICHEIKDTTAADGLVLIHLAYIS